MEEMTDEQINALIAEVIDADPHWKCAKDYCSDLSAMHEAERMFIGPIESQYAENLVEITNADWMEQTRFFCATARQRAEAFLRTLGMWYQSGERTEMVKEVQK